MFGPLAFGAVEPWSIYILETGSVLLTLLWLCKQWLDGELNIQWNPLFPPMAGFGVLILLQIVLRHHRLPPRHHLGSASVLRVRDAVFSRGANPAAQFTGAQDRA